VSGLASKPLGRFLIGLGLKTDGDGLSVVWPQNHWGGFLRFGLKNGGNGFSSVSTSKLMTTVCEWFGLKTSRMIFTGLASKLVVMVSGGLASKPAAAVSASLASKPATTVSNGLASKPAATVSGGLASKPAVSVSPFGSQNRQLRFVDLGLKITAAVSWFGHQNQAVFGLSVVTQNRRREVSVGHASRSSGFFTWNQVGLGFSSLFSRLVKTR
jgi:hypothetical protein